MLGASSISEIPISVSDTSYFNMYNGRDINITLSIQQQDSIVSTIDSGLGIILTIDASSSVELS